MTTRPPVVPNTMGSRHSHSVSSNLKWYELFMHCDWSVLINFTTRGSVLLHRDSLPSRTHKLPLLQQSRCILVLFFILTSYTCGQERRRIETNLKFTVLRVRLALLIAPSSCQWSHLRSSAARYIDTVSNNLGVRHCVLSPHCLSASRFNPNIHIICGASA